MTDITFSDSIIIEAIKELSPNVAGGPDGIPASLLINCAEEIAPALKIIFSHSLSSSLIPTSFKEAAIIPVFKSGDKSLPSNYRPISLTSVLIKVIEKIIRKQFLTFLSHRGYLNSTQHGFRSGRSCLCALLDVYDNIMHMINNKSTVDMIYLEFSKAFDKVECNNRNVYILDYYLMCCVLYSILLLINIYRMYYYAVRHHILS